MKTRLQHLFKIGRTAWLVSHYRSSVLY